MFNLYPEHLYQRLTKLLHNSSITSEIYDKSWDLILKLYEKNALLTDYNIQFILKEDDKIQIYWTLLKIYCEITPKYYILHYSKKEKFKSVDVLIDKLIKFL